MALAWCSGFVAYDHVTLQTLLQLFTGYVYYMVEFKTAVTAFPVLRGLAPLYVDQLVSVADFPEPWPSPSAFINITFAACLSIYTSYNRPSLVVSGCCVHHLELSHQTFSCRLLCLCSPTTQLFRTSIPDITV